MPLKFKIKKNDDCKIQPSASKNQLGYVIVGPNCGRDKKGIFNCECGKCKELVPDIGQNRNDSGNYRSDSSDD